MTPKEFAIKAGCIVSEMEDPKNWGGKWQYQSADSLNCFWCGFKTEDAAYRGFLKDTFGEQASKALIALLKKTEGKK